MRLYAAIVTGALAEVVTLTGLWLWTDMEICGMMFLSVFGYFIGLAAVLCLTEPTKQKKRQRVRREMRTYNLREDEYCLIEEKVS